MIPPPLSSGQASTRGQRRSRHEDQTARNDGSDNGRLRLCERMGQTTEQQAMLMRCFHSKCIVLSLQGSALVDRQKCRKSFWNFGLTSTVI